MHETYFATPPHDLARAANGRYGRRLGLFLAVSALAWASAGSAEDTDGDSVPSSDYISQLKACRDIAANDQRLACFDTAVSAMVAATDSGEVSIVDREDVRETRRSLFGFTMPKGGIFGSSDDDEDTSMLESTITDVRRLGGDTYVITIAEGSKWQMSNVPMRLRTPRAGDAVVFKKAALGSYFIRIAGQTGVKGRRIE
jgi:hypothetical protein